MHRSALEGGEGLVAENSKSAGDHSPCGFDSLLRDVDFSKSQQNFKICVFLVAWGDLSIKTQIGEEKLKTLFDNSWSRQ